MSNPYFHPKSGIEAMRLPIPTWPVLPIPPRASVRMWTPPARFGRRVGRQTKIRANGLSGKYIHLKGMVIMNENQCFFHFEGEYMNEQ